MSNWHKWLHFAAAPTFALMALVTAASDGSAPMALCSGAGSFGLNGMTPMYLLMATFHLRPWLKLVFLGGGMTLFSGIDRSGRIQTMEQKR
jgi:hypothetical protein